MSEIFGTIRKESVISTFEAVLCGKYITRSSIAEKTGISVMTVGKIIDIMLSEGILIQSTFPSKTPGRRSRSVACNKKSWGAVIYLSEMFYSFYFFNLSLKVIKEITYKKADSVFVDDVLEKFARDIENYISEQHKASDCFGYGIILSDDYDSDNDKIISNGSLRYIKPMRLFSSHSLGNVPLIIDGSETFSHFYAAQKNDDYNGLIISIEKSQMKCNYISGGRSSGVMNTGLAFPINSPEFHPLTFNDLLKDKSKAIYFSEKLSEYLIPVITTIPIDEITVTGDLFYNTDALTEIIAEKTEELCNRLDINMPRFIYEDHKTVSALGMAKDMRDNWFSKKYLT